MIFSYRTRRRLRRLSLVLLVLALIATMALLIWLLWLNRFIVYTRDGVKLDFSVTENLSGGNIAGTADPYESIYIEYDPTVSTEPVSTELQQLDGYYIPAEDLKGDLQALKDQISQLPAGTPIMLDVKNIRGEFYYSSNVGHPSSAVSQAAIDDLIAFLRDGHYYLMARLPALRDYNFGLNNVPCGLFKINIVALWMDEARCYWLNPLKDGTVQHLVRIVTELRTLGFDEVVFYDFRFPDTDQIRFTEDKDMALATCAQTLVSACSSETFTVSFVSTNPAFPLPEGRCRLYMENITAENIYDITDQITFADPDKRLVFLTDSNDTRYDDYCVMHPLDTAH